MEDKKNKNRSSNLELLRILSMFLIVCHHFALHGKVPLWDGMISVDNPLRLFFMQFLSIGGKIGVDLFVIITGYFLVSQNCKARSLFKLILTTSFYSVSIYLIFYLSGQTHFSIRTLVSQIFPITSGQYWFVSTYILLCIASPYISMGIRCCALDSDGSSNINDGNGKKRLVVFLSIFALLWSIMPTILCWPFVAGSRYDFSNLGWFVYLFVVGGFIRLYPATYERLITKKLIISLVLCLFTIILWIVFCDLCLRFGFDNRWNFFYWSEMNSLPVLLVSIIIFILFSRLEARPSLFINSIASTMFGVYLIHDNNFIRGWLWSDTFEVLKNFNEMSAVFYV